MLPRYAKRRDANEPGIVKALRNVGALVRQMDFPDLMVRYGGRVTLLEVDGGKRTGTGKRRAAQLAFLEEWEIPMVKTPEQALREIGAIWEE